MMLHLSSFLYRTERLSGTGTHESRGFPRSYYFSWVESAGGVSQNAGLNWFYFFLNWAAWAAVAGVVAWMLARPRPGPGR